MTFTSIYGILIIRNHHFLCEVFYVFDITQDDKLIRLINRSLAEGKIIELRNLPRKGVPINVCVVEIGRKVLTERKTGE